MKDAENLEVVCSLAPDFIGFIFFKGSVRYIGIRPDPALFSIPRKETTRVGVFVNEPLISVQRIVDAGWLDMVQLHGSETPAYCKALVNEGIHVIKALDPGLIGNENGLKAYYGVVHYFLFDTPGENHGGTGRKFDWDVLTGYSLPVPFFLSGGIGPDDAPAIRELEQMWFHGVDLNSRFEREPGLKNVKQLENFFKEIR
ncbi:MAG: phosphoribosylanthranilate isomerase, partial [Bacteroidota bacterium]